MPAIRNRKIGKADRLATGGAMVLAFMRENPPVYPTT
jgi:hypothetical protein